MIMIMSSTRTHTVVRPCHCALLGLPCQSSFLGSSLQIWQLSCFNCSVVAVLFHMRVYGCVCVCVCVVVITLFIAVVGIVFVAVACLVFAPA